MIPLPLPPERGCCVLQACAPIPGSCGIEDWPELSRVGQALCTLSRPPRSAVLSVWMWALVWGLGLFSFQDSVLGVLPRLPSDSQSPLLVLPECGVFRYTTGPAPILFIKLYMTSLPAYISHGIIHFVKCLTPNSSSRTWIMCDTLRVPCAMCVPITLT